MTVYLRQEWLDTRLNYVNNTSFSNVGHVTMDSKLYDSIWVPDLFFPNEKIASVHQVTVPNRLLRIFPDGKVLYSSRYTAAEKELIDERDNLKAFNFRYSMTIGCHMSLESFPFDEQTCSLKMESCKLSLLILYSR